MFYFRPDESIECRRRVMRVTDDQCLVFSPQLVGGNAPPQPIRSNKFAKLSKKESNQLIVTCFILKLVLSGIHTSSETAFFSADITPEKSPCNQGKLCQHWKKLKLKISNFSIFQGWQSSSWLHGIFSGLMSALKKAVSELVWIPLKPYLHGYI